MRRHNTLNNFYDEVVLGNVPGHSVVQKFGRNEAVPTTIVPVCIGGIYQTPTVAVTLEVISDDADDTAAGTGARNVILQGLDQDFNLIEEELATAGLSASAATTLTFIRLFRIKVTKSGSYATQTATSQHGTLTIRQSGAGATWATIDEIATDFGVGQSQIGAYTIPNGYTALLLSKFVSVETTKSINAYFFQRPNAHIIAAPFEGMRLVEQETGIIEALTRQTKAPLQKFYEKTDIGFMAIASVGTASVSCDFELMLIENDYID